MGRICQLFRFDLTIGSPAALSGLLELVIDYRTFCYDLAHEVTNGHVLGVVLIRIQVRSGLKGGVEREVVGNRRFIKILAYLQLYKRGNQAFERV